MQEKYQATQTMQYITDSVKDVPWDKHFPRYSFPLYPSHIYFIRCILHRFHGGRIAMRSDTRSHTLMHTHMRQDPRSSLVHVLFFFSLSLSLSASSKKGRCCHQQPHIISIEKDTKELHLMTTNI